MLFRRGNQSANGLYHEQPTEKPLCKPAKRNCDHTRDCGLLLCDGGQPGFLDAGAQPGSDSGAGSNAVFCRFGSGEIADSGSYQPAECARSTASRATTSRANTGLTEFSGTVDVRTYGVCTDDGCPGAGPSDAAYGFASEAQDAPTSCERRSPSGSAARTTRRDAKGVGHHARRVSQGQRGVGRKDQL